MLFEHPVLHAIDAQHGGNAFIELVCCEIMHESISGHDRAAIMLKSDVFDIRPFWLCGLDKLPELCHLLLVAFYKRQNKLL